MAALSVAALGLTLVRCGAGARDRVVVSGGDSTPLSERADPSPYDGIEDRTAIVAYEFGRCDADSDCSLVGCGGGMCGSESEPAVCAESAVSACLARVGPGACGCVEGVCRWARTAPVLQCARYEDEPPESRGRYRGPGPYDEYPLRSGAGGVP